MWDGRNCIIKLIHTHSNDTHRKSFWSFDSKKHLHLSFEGNHEFNVTCKWCVVLMWNSQDCSVWWYHERKKTRFQLILFYFVLVFCCASMKIRKYQVRERQKLNASKHNKSRHSSFELLRLAHRDWHVEWTHLKRDSNYGLIEFRIRIDGVAKCCGGCGAVWAKQNTNVHKF